jgi:hypothetical protein
MIVVCQESRDGKHPRLITGASLRLGIPRRRALQLSSSPLPRLSPASPARLNASIIIQQMEVFNTTDCLTLGVHHKVFTWGFFRSSAELGD